MLNHKSLLLRFLASLWLLIWHRHTAGNYKTLLLDRCSLQMFKLDLTYSGLTQISFAASVVGLFLALSSASSCRVRSQPFALLDDAAFDEDLFCLLLICVLRHEAQRFVRRRCRCFASQPFDTSCPCFSCPPEWGQNLCTASNHRKPR